MNYTASLVASEAAARRLADLIADEAGLTVDLRALASGDWEVVAYLEASPVKELSEFLTRSARDVLAHGDAGFIVAGLPETDWVAKSLRDLKPVRAGRFLVHGGHDRDKRRPNDIAIEIEAAEAFGTGHHGTTAGCLLAIDALAKSRRIRNALDLGTGTGVLAIAIAKRFKAPVLASDVDPIAVAIAAGNTRANGVAGLVRTVTGAGLGRRVFRDRRTFDLVVANILAGPLVALAPALRRHLASGGTLILSGLLPGQRARIVAAFRGQGLRLVRDFRLDDWLTVVLVRPPRTDRMRRPRAPVRHGRARRLRASHRHALGGSR
jgi:ribosomal protein L11 methyltransferase